MESISYSNITIKLLDNEIRKQLSLSSVSNLEIEEIKTYMITITELIKSRDILIKINTETNSTKRQNSDSESGSGSGSDTSATKKRKISIKNDTTLHTQVEIPVDIPIDISIGEKDCREIVPITPTDTFLSKNEEYINLGLKNSRRRTESIGSPR